MECALATKVDGVRFSLSIFNRPFLHAGRADGLPFARRRARDHRQVHRRVQEAHGRTAERLAEPGAGAPTANTEELIAEAGFLWYGDYNHIDLPFCVNTKKGTLVALPHSDFADHRVLRGNPRDWYDVYKDTFDYLYANEAISYLNITLHCHFGGRPLMAAQVDRILKYIRGFPDVWLVRHDELAEWIKSNKIAEWTNEQRFFSRN